MAFNFFKKKSKKEDESQPAPKPEMDPTRPHQDGQIKEEHIKEEPQSATENQTQSDETVPPSKDDHPQDQSNVVETEPEKPTTSSESKTAPVNAPNEEANAEDATQPNESGLFSKLKSGLSKTRDVLNTDVTELFSRSTAIDEDLFEELEEMLVMSDLGVDISMAMMERIRKKAKKLETADQLRQVLKEELLALFPPMEESTPTTKPHVLMMVGVNGTGKTTTLGKLATRYVRDGKKVLIAAADTFRAAAIEQVEVWADRAGAGIVKHREGADPAAVAYDAVEAAIARGVDIVIIDTAGRLHTQKNLMEELKKIRRSVDKKLKGAPHQVMMVIDATTGQNAISQAKMFNEAVGLTHMAVTKLDGTAKGGIVAAVSSGMNLPISHIGVGEGVDDLQDFDAKRFINALFD